MADAPLLASRAYPNMNTLKRLLLALALATGLCAQIHAETADKPEKAPRVSRVEKLAAALALTDEQKVQVAAIYKEENAALRLISDDQSLDRSAKIARNREIRESHAARIRNILTPEQQERFDALPKGRESTAEKKAADAS